MSPQNGRTARRVAGVVLAFTISGLVAGWLLWSGWGTASVFFAFLSLAALEVYLTGLVIVWLVLSSISWLLLPRPTKSSFQHRRNRFRLITFVCFALFLVIGWYINRHWLPGRFQPISLTADFFFAVVVATFGLLLLRPRPRNAAIFIVAAVAFGALVFFIRPTPPGVAETRTDPRGLGTLAYVSWTPPGDIEKSGVTLFDSTRACDGLNLYNSSNEAVARLIDNTGKQLHEWSSIQTSRDRFDHIELCPNGDLVVLKSKRGRSRRIVRLDWDSNVLWEVIGDYHHDISVASNGDIYTILSRSEVVSFHGMPLPIINEYVVVLAPSGRIKRETPLYGLFADRMKRRRIRDNYTYMITPPGWKIMFDVIRRRDPYLYYDRFDPFHVNNIEVLPSAIDKPGAEEILICVRNLDLVARLDSNSSEIRYEWGPGHLQRPHHPSMLTSGNMLVFDNGPFRGYSRVAELDPASGSTVWEYTADTPEDFLSTVQGACQRLTNGNTLITDSMSGRAFEVTKDGEIVWEFLNPDVDKKTNRRSTIYRFIRIDNPADFPGVAAAATPRAQSR